MKKRRMYYALITFLLIVTEFLIALFVDDRFVRPYLGDVIITILLCCFCRIFFPDGLTALPLFVFLFAAAVEVSQYFDLVKLLGFENSKFLSTLMGRVFSWADLVCYAAGCAIFFALDLAFRKHSLRS